MGERFGKMENKVLLTLLELGGESTLKGLNIKICNENRNCYKSMWRSIKNLEKKGFLVRDGNHVMLIGKIINKAL